MFQKNLLNSNNDVYIYSKIMNIYHFTVTDFQNVSINFFSISACKNSNDVKFDLEYIQCNFAKVFVKMCSLQTHYPLSQIASSNKFNDCCGSLIITLKKNTQNSNCLKISKKVYKDLNWHLLCHAISVLSFLRVIISSILVNFM